MERINEPETKYAKGATNSFVFMALVISVISKLQGIAAINDSLANVILACSIILVSIYLIRILNMKLNSLYVISLFISVSVALINLAPQMVAATMMILLFYLVEYGGEKIDFDVVLKAFIISSIIFFALIVLANIFFKFNSNHNISMWRINKMIDRSSLGFNHPNQADIQWLSIVIAAVGAMKSRHWSIGYLTLFLATLYVYTKTLSRSSTVIIVVLLLFLSFLGKKADKVVNKKMRIALSFLPIAIMLFSLMIILKDNYSSSFNNILSGRLALYKQFYSYYGIHFLRQSALESAMFDNSYLQSIQSKGILYAAVLMGIYVKIGNFWNKVTWKNELIFCCICTLGFTETIFQHFELIFPLLLVIGKQGEKIKK